VTITHLPDAARRRNHYPPVALQRQVRRAGVHFGEGLGAAVHAGFTEHVLTPGLETSSRAPSSPRPSTRRQSPQPVGQPVHQRRLGTDQIQSSLALGGSGRGGIRSRARYTGCPGHDDIGMRARDTWARACSSPPEPRTHTLSAANRAATHAAKRKNCYRPGPNPRMRIAGVARQGNRR